MSTVEELHLQTLKSNRSLFTIFC